jgi:2-dehydro-3-deoxygluconokinase
LARAYSRPVLTRNPRKFRVSSPADATGSCQEALKVARAAAVSTSIDLNYRVKLWTPEQAGPCLAQMMQSCDWLVTMEEDIERVFGIKGKDYEEAATLTCARFPLKAVWHAY